MSKAASTEEMQLLHSELTATVRQEIKTREEIITETDKDGNQVERVRVVRPSPAWAAIAAKLLKDNSVTMAPAEGNETGELEKELAEMRAKRTMPSAQDRADAMAALGSSLLQ